MDNILFLGQQFVQFTILYIYFLLSGRSLYLLLSKSKFIHEKESSSILQINKQLIFPILGIFFTGNLLVVINFILPLKSQFVYIILLIFLLPNAYKLNFKDLFNLNIKKLFYYFIIPSILLISSYDILFHYDAGYYHLNNQNWLRESNLILGFVNIFWAFGMSSIYEYISAILWFDDIFLFLHYLNIIFIQFFYVLLSENILTTKINFLKNSSILILLFSFLDNLGLGGGRNGFIYIQGIGKQDIAVGILFYFLTIAMISFIITKKIRDIEVVILSLLGFFIFQIKVSGVLISILYFTMIFILVKNKKLTLNKVLILQIPVVIIGLIWLLKTYLLTGCFIFPLNLSCVNNFSWYIPESTESYELISKESSLNYVSSIPFIDWFTKFTNYTFYKNTYLNFLGSFVILFIAKKLLFNKDRVHMNIFFTASIFVLINIIYLIFYGPIPRYSIGISMVSIALLALFTADLRFDYSKYLSYVLIFLSVVLVVRANSYISFLTNANLLLFNPVEEAEYMKYNDDWYVPDSGDQCWVNLECSMAQDDVTIDETGFFKVAYK